jgi:hypothetical protein
MLHVPPTLWVRIIAFSGQQCTIECRPPVQLFKLASPQQALQPRERRLCSEVWINSHKYEEYQQG